MSGRPDISTLQLIEQRVANEGPNLTVAFVLWFILGGLGGHRFYLGKPLTAAVQILLLISFFGWIVLVPWLLVDLFLIPGIAQQRREALRDKLLMEFHVPGGAPMPQGSRSAAVEEGYAKVDPQPANPQIVS